MEVVSFLLAEHFGSFASLHLDWDAIAGRQGIINRRHRCHNVERDVIVLGARSWSPQGKGGRKQVSRPNQGQKIGLSLTKLVGANLICSIPICGNTVCPDKDEINLSSQHQDTGSIICNQLRTWQGQTK
jgi:hypothetical protein